MKICAESGCNREVMIVFNPQKKAAIPTKNSPNSDRNHKYIMKEEIILNMNTIQKWSKISRNLFIWPLELFLSRFNGL